MKAIVLVYRDGARHMAFVINAAFDTQAWAQSRKAAFAMLEVVAVEEH